MKIPKKIHFAGFDYTVKFEKELEGGDTWGRTSMKRRDIVIEKDMDVQNQEETFLHELLHIAYRHTQGWESKSYEDEEKQVKAWAMNIYGILKDNNLLK